MPEPTFLGITKATWDLYNGFANWFAALGSFAAAAAALYIASRANRISAKVSITRSLIVYSGQSTRLDVIAFRIVNTGDRRIRVTNIGWMWGKKKKRFAVQTCDPAQSTRIPCDLEYGEEATFIVPFAPPYGTWLSEQSPKMFDGHPKSEVNTLRAQFHTSVGKTFIAKPEESFFQEIRDALP
jgi:hypothetical protein